MRSRPCLGLSGATPASLTPTQPADSDGIAFKRSPEQVLNIVFLNPAKGVYKGGFFPDGVNGVVRHS